jgi:hypothetical protein
MVALPKWIAAAGDGKGLVHANVWFGGGGTITGLHLDSYQPLFLVTFLDCFLGLVLS